jgi:hypothetical protein
VISSIANLPKVLEFYLNSHSEFGYPDAL